MTDECVGDGGGVEVPESVSEGGREANFTHD